MSSQVIAEQNLEWLLAAASDAMLIADGEGLIVLANPAAHQLFGFEPGTLSGTQVDMLLPERARARHSAQRAHYADQPRQRQMGTGFDLHARHRDGKEFPVEVSLSPLKGPEGMPLILATVHDISARKQAEAKLQESENRMRAVFETAVDAIITIDDHGRLERFNPAAERVFGYLEAEVAGKNISMLMPEPDRSAHDGYMQHYLQTGEARIIGKGREVHGRRKDGSIFPMDLAVAEMKIGERRMFTGIVRDVTERRRAEDALRNLAMHQEKAKEQERKRIAQEIHDELGGLLTGIKAYLSVAIERAGKGGATPEPLLAETAGLVRDAIGTVRRVITDLRPSVLDQLGVWAALEWYAEQVEQRAGLHCTCNIDPRLDALELDAERSTMLFRILQEGLTNVVRHAEATEFTLDVRGEGDDIHLTLDDNGKGIDTDSLLNKTSWGILGMHERARQCGGSLTIKGQPGKGTTLHLCLPRKQEHEQ